MANALTAKRDRITLQFHNALSAQGPLVERVGFVRRDQTQTLRMTSQHLEHAWGDFNGSAPTATDVNSYALTHTATARAAKVAFTREEIEDAVQASGVNDLIEVAVAQLADQARNDMDRAFFAGLNGLFSTAHPLTADLTGNPDYFATDLTITGIGPGGADVVVNNLLTSPLSESSFFAARQRLMEQTNWAGDPLNIMGPYCLVVSPKNERLARQLVSSPSVDQSASNPQGYSNLAGPEVTDVVVTSLLSDDDDWFLVYKGLNDKGLGSPVGLWERTAPMINVREDDMYNTFIEAYSRRSFVYTPDGLGIIGSNVA